jgi:hypothetical protein
MRCGFVGAGGGLGAFLGKLRKAGFFVERNEPVERIEPG